jgi:hypothetical protein
MAGGQAPCLGTSSRLRELIGVAIVIANRRRYTGAFAMATGSVGKMNLDPLFTENECF